MPYPYATADHQRLNAEQFARAGAAIVVADAELDPARLRTEVGGLQGDPARLAAMAQATRAAARPGRGGRASPRSCWGLAGERAAA